MSKIVGDLNWIYQPQSSELNYSKSNTITMITETYITHVNYLDDGLREWGSDFEPKNTFEANRAESMSLVDIKIQPYQDINVYKVTYQYATSDYSLHISAKAEGQTVSTLDSAAMETQIEKHKNYKTYWNHYLMTDSGESLPAWAESAKDRSDETEHIKWTKDPNSLGTDWTILQTPKKDQVEAFIQPAPVVNETTYYASEDSANDAADAVGKKVAPSKTYNKPSGAEHWLCMSAQTGYDKEVQMHTVTRSFQFAEDIDKEVYDE